MYYLKLFIVGLFFMQTMCCVGQSKFTECNFLVQGVCAMCEDRIENALDLKGIKLAAWDLKSKRIRVIYKNTLYTEEELHVLIAEAGHSTEKVKATKAAYEKLHKCCRYE